jgi:hypothetical protein
MGLALVVPASAADAVIQDGDFEIPAVKGSYQVFDAGTSIGPWTVSAGSVDLVNGRWAAYDGTQSIDLNACITGAISQTVATTPNTTSTVRFSSSAVHRRVFSDEMYAKHG